MENWTEKVWFWFDSMDGMGMKGWKGLQVFSLQLKWVVPFLSFSAFFWLVPW